MCAGRPLNEDLKRPDGRQQMREFDPRRLPLINQMMTHFQYGIKSVQLANWYPLFGSTAKLLIGLWSLRKDTAFLFFQTLHC